VPSGCSHHPCISNCTRCRPGRPRPNTLVHNPPPYSNRHAKSGGKQKAPQKGKAINEFLARPKSKCGRQACPKGFSPPQRTHCPEQASKETGKSRLRTDGHTTFGLSSRLSPISRGHAHVVAQDHHRVSPHPCTTTKAHPNQHPSFPFPYPTLLATYPMARTRAFASIGGYTTVVTRRPTLTTFPRRRALCALQAAY
jgi:hypothetical protein